LAETGITGLLLFLIPIVGLLYLGYKSAFSRIPGFEIIILSIGLTAYLVFAFFDFPFQNAEHRFLFYFQLLLLCQHLSESKRVESKTVISINKHVLLVSVIVLCMITVIQIRSDYHSLKMVGNYPKAFPLVKSALTINPFEVRILNDYGMLLSYQGNRDASIEAFQKASNLAPYFEDPRFNLSAIYFSEGNYKKALEILATVGDSKKKQDYILQINAARKDSE